MRVAALAFATAAAIAAVYTGGAAFAATSLVDAASAQERAAALALLAEGADPNARSPDNTTALHCAAYHDDVDLAQRLVAAGADANAMNDYGSFPLAEPAGIGNPEKV